MTKGGNNEANNEKKINLIHKTTHTNTHTKFDWKNRRKKEFTIKQYDKYGE